MTYEQVLNIVTNKLMNVHIASRQSYEIQNMANTAHRVSIEYLKALEVAREEYEKVNNCRG